MRSWLPTQSSTDVSLRVTLPRQRLASLLAPATAIVDTASLHVTPDGLGVRAADDAHVRSATATLDADACSQYAVTPGALTFDPTTLRAALAADATLSAATDPITLAYATGDPTLSVSLPNVTHEQPVDPTHGDRVPQVTEWPGGATLHHRADALADVCEYFATISEVIAVGYDASRNVFRIGSVADPPVDDATSIDDEPSTAATGAYERSGAALPGETAAATVRTTVDGALLGEIVATAPGDAHLRLDVADAHPLRLGWTVPSPDQPDGTPVEVTALLAPRDPPARDESDTESAPSG